KRSVFDHDRLVEQQLIVQQEEADAGSGAHAEQAQKPEKLQRPRGVVKQKLNADQVEQNSNGSGKAVVRLALFTDRVFDRDFHDRCPGPACQGWNEAMQFAVETNIPE